MLVMECEGSGATPGESDVVRVHYEGRLLDGTRFASSREQGEPEEFALDGVIQGWFEGLQIMAAGGKARLIVPPALAYGDVGSPPRIPGRATLIFEIELLDVLGAQR